jgi:folylpolyglutamate synthase/dihydropteroate synthase
MAGSNLKSALDVMPSLPKPPSLWGRFQPVHWQLRSGLQVEVILDCCHNVAGCKAFLDSLREFTLGRKGPIPRAFVSILRDKQVNEMLDLLRAEIPELLLFQVANERSITMQDLAPRHRDLLLFPSFLALRDGLLQCPGDLRPAVICGSIYALGEVLRMVGHDFVA